MIFPRCLVVVTGNVLIHKRKLQHDPKYVHQEERSTETRGTPFLMSMLRIAAMDAKHLSTLAWKENARDSRH